MLSEKKLGLFLTSVEGTGAIFASLFLIVYLLGLRDLPKDVVYHSEPVFRTLLSIFGTLFVILISITLILSYRAKGKA